MYSEYTGSVRAGMYMRGTERMPMMHMEPYLRAGLFLGLFIVIALGERLFPRRQTEELRRTRWFNNLSILAIGTFCLRLLFPVLPVGLALICTQRGWGILNNYSLPFAVEVIVSVLVLDLVIYLQHVLFHAVPALWRMHVMHHSDLDFDVTTALRFHPLELILSMGIKLSMVMVLGPPPVAVLIFEILLNGASMFNHSNLSIPPRMDRLLRLLIVTPDMHRVHHSVIIRETNSNYGFNLSWWDRLMGTYRAQPARGHDGMTIGIGWLREKGLLTLPGLLIMPFRQIAGRHPAHMGDKKKGS